MKKKQIVLILVVIIIVFAIIFGIAYHFRDRRTYSLNIPQVENLKSISLKVNENDKQYSASYNEEEVMKKILDIIAGTKRITKEESIQDYPIKADNVIMVKFYFKEQGSSILYLYKNNNKFYIEQPYNGIYKISEDEYKSVNNYTIVPYENDDVNNKKISMSIKNNTLTNNGMTLVMKNNANQTYHYGSEYSLEKYENGKFITYEPKDPLSWNAILYNIKVNEEKEEVIEWSYGYDKLKSGKYRLVRHFTSEENLPYSSNVAEKFYVEFEIK